MIRNLLLLAIAALAACASRDSPTSDEAPLVVARVERVDSPISIADTRVFDALGPAGLALRALLGGDEPPTAAVLLTQTGERVLFALGPAADRQEGRPIAVGDCVGLLPVDASAGLRPRYLAGQARLAPSRACGQLGK